MNEYELDQSSLEVAEWEQFWQAADIPAEQELNFN